MPKRTSKTTAKKKPAKKAATKKKAAKKRATKKTSAKKAAAKKKPAPKKATKKKAAKKTASSPRGWAPGFMASASTERPAIIESSLMMQAAAAGARRTGKTIGFVPTMGALHQGHLALIREARLRADVVVVSIFVNPLQFNDPKDLRNYPKTFEKDLQLCRDAGVDVVFAPDESSLYPPGFQTTLVAGGLAKGYEGQTRPGHFDGMLTVVNKLFHLVMPHFAVFGEKDFQQLLLVKRMVRDLHMPVEIVPMPVIREDDGLACASRNARLAKKHRKHATCLFEAIEAAQALALDGENDGRRIVNAARSKMRKRPDFVTEYVALVDPVSLDRVHTLERPARLLLAGRFEGARTVRLIDNGPVFPRLVERRKVRRD